MSKVLVVVDMQNDFVDGVLGTGEAVAILDNVVRKINSWDGPVVATRDTHGQNYSETQEGRRLPVPHCIKGSRGWEINDRVAEALKCKNAQIVDKPGFGSTVLAELLKTDAGCGNDVIEEIQLIGVCTGICVISNAILLKAALPEVRIAVDAECCACVTPDTHRTALEAMKTCQIDII